MSFASNEQVTVTFTAQEWNVLLGLLIEAPYRVVAPLIQKIGEQARPQQQPVSPPLQRANGGEAHHASD
jgi:hypothetical protein